MGIVRVLLALAVVFTHTTGFVFVGGQLAVQLFYMISGFLISSVLTEARAYQHASSFYLNRFLRLYPVYWAVALITLLMYGAAFLVPAWSEALQVEPEFASVYRNAGGGGVSLLTFGNLFLFGQDWVMFSGIRDGALQFVTDFEDSEVPLWRGLLVPQAWTLGVELSFYVIAPFVLRRRKLIWTLLALSLAVRLYLIQVGLAFSDPWTYRFFPAELAFFLFGALSHQLLKPLYVRWFGTHLATIAKATTILVCTYVVVFFLLPYRGFNTLLLIALFILCLPLLSEFQLSRRWDRKVGDLSYPLYICHRMIGPPAVACISLFPVSHVFGVKVLFYVFAALLASYVIERVVSKRVELLRARIRNRDLPRTAPPARITVT